MRFGSNAVLKSYAKTTVACLVLVSVALLLAVFGLSLLPKIGGPVVAALGVLVALCAATLTCACAIVLVRHRRSELGRQDLFLELNRSRDPAAIKAGAATRAARLRRRLAKRLLGHELVVGDLVEIKTWPEIRATLDERGCFEQLPFMPEMLAMCGQRAYVFRCLHRLFDYRKTRRMRHMDRAVLLVGTVCDGARHGGCEAACHTIWKSAWLRRVKPGTDTAGAPLSCDGSADAKDAVLQFGIEAPRYACQLTQLHAASRPIGKWSATNFLLPLIAGNVSPSAFAVGWLTHLFDEIQHKRRGAGFPEFEAAAGIGGKREEPHWKAGDQVVVRSSAEIRDTLNERFMHRGLWFEPDMLKHCRRRYRVQAEVRRLIDIVSGEMRTMKTPAYILRDVHFSGERQLFNAQCEPLFWRGAWLQETETRVEREAH